MKKLKILMVAGAATMLSSCDLSQIPGLDGKLSIEDSKAVGAACRHSGRALEDCFTLNPSSYQSGVFEGWRDMNDYMLANQIEVVKPEISTSAFKRESAPADHPASHSSPAEHGSGSADTTLEAVPLIQGRQRWVPKGSELPSSAGNTGSLPPTQEPSETRQSSPAATRKEESTAKEEPATGAPPRPWERKKDPKKHT